MWIFRLLGLSALLKVILEVLPSVKQVSVGKLYGSDALKCGGFGDTACA